MPFAMQVASLRQWWHVNQLPIWCSKKEIGDCLSSSKQLCCSVLCVDVKRLQSTRTVFAYVLVETAHPLRQPTQIPLPEEAGGGTVTVSLSRVQVYPRGSGSPLEPPQRHPAAVMRVLASAQRGGRLADAGRMNRSGLACVLELACAGAADGIDLVAESSSTDGVVAKKRIHSHNHVSLFFVACKSEDASRALLACDDSVVWLGGTRFVLEVAAARSQCELYDIPKRQFRSKTVQQEAERAEFGRARERGRAAAAAIRTRADSAVACDLFGSEPPPPPPRLSPTAADCGCCSPLRLPSANPSPPPTPAAVSRVCYSGRSSPDVWVHNPYPEE